MDNKRTIQRKGNKKKKRPKVRFNFWVMFIIFALSFASCFILYILAANFNDNFFKDEFENSVVELQETDVIRTTTEAIQSTTEEKLAVTNPVPLSDAAPESFFDTACIVTDSTLSDMAEYGKFAANNVFMSDELNAANCNTTKIPTSFGTVSVYELIKNKKPPVLYLMLGSDLGTSDMDDMVKNYTMLIKNLHSALPEMDIYVMQIPPIISETETLTTDMINSYNTQILSMCNSAGVYCIDINTALKAGNGLIAEEYYSYESAGISVMGYKEICNYIRTHTV